jgi:5-methylcytosine-specific restriction enzyme B
MAAISEVEWEFRVRRYQQLRAQVADVLDESMERRRIAREAGRAEVEQIIDEFRSGGSVEDLRSGLDQWSRGAPHWGFGGPNGAMFLNQLVHDSDTTTITDLLRRAIDAPSSDAGAEALMVELHGHVESLRSEGSSAQSGRVAPLLSWFWWVADADRWPMLWASIWRFLGRNGFQSGWTTPWEYYTICREHIRRFGPAIEVEAVCFAIDESDQYGLDITTCDRLALVARARTPEADPDAYAASRKNLELLREMAKPFGKAGAEALGSVFDAVIDFRQPSIYWDRANDRLRGNLSLSWTPRRTVVTPSLFLVADGEQVQIGLHASSMPSGQKGFSRRTYELLADQVPEDVAVWMQFAGFDSKQASERPSLALLGRRFSIDAFQTHTQAIDCLVEMAKTLLPAFQLVWDAEATDSESPPDPVEPAEASDESLRSLAEQFIAEQGYPDDTDRRHHQAQREWQRLLKPGSLATVPLVELRRIYGGNSYGSPGQQTVLHTTLSDEDPLVVDRFRAAIEYLLWDEASVEERIDRVMDEDDLGLRGFKEGAIMKFLAVARPAEFLAVYPFTGTRGKAAMLDVLGQEVPPMSASVGQRQVRANNALMSIVAPLFPGDTWAQSQFLYWLMSRAEESGLTLDDLTTEADEDLLDLAAEELLLSRDFLDEIHGLLKQHKQVVFYGPPGTGKTYVAQRLAEALAPIDDHRMLVQFHPSTSYEDFFEGYRPLATGDDQMVYKLVSGPLRIMAERAASDLTGRPHILMIDEINRANLAKVLGELLYLLEYRDREIHPLYRPSETFTLPENLWLIGTMNTADRSIATVDAALRRRFHFVPFIPDDRPDNPISGLLGRWLDENDEPAWVGDLVDGVNQKLRKELGGDHLLLGPSYFMQEGLDRTSLALIWRYRIEPLVDDLFFGDTRAKAFHFEAVWNEFGEDAAEAE